MHIFAKETVYFTAIKLHEKWVRLDRHYLFTPIKELYKSSSVLDVHSQHIIINIQKHFKR